MSLTSFSGEFRRLGPSYLFQPINPTNDVWSFFEVDPGVTFYPGLLAEPYTDVVSGKSLVRPATDANKVIGVFHNNSYNIAGLYVQTKEYVVATDIDTSGPTFKLVLSKKNVKETPWVAIQDKDGNWVYANGSASSPVTDVSVESANGVITVTVDNASHLPAEGDTFTVIYYYKNPYFDSRLTSIVPDAKVTIWGGSVADTVVYLPGDYAAGDELTLANFGLAGIGGVLKKKTDSSEVTLGVVLIPPFDPFGRMRVKFTF